TSSLLDVQPECGNNDREYSPLKLVLRTPSQPASESGCRGLALTLFPLSTYDLPSCRCARAPMGSAATSETRSLLEFHHAQPSRTVREPILDRAHQRSLASCCAEH